MLTLLFFVSLFVRLWVEMAMASVDTNQALVSLFVRLWVEISFVSHTAHIASSASSWGCELKYRYLKDRGALRRQPLREAVSWNNIYISTGADRNSQPLREAVSWNINQVLMLRDQDNSQPLREAVSWNISSVLLSTLLSSSASSWGCELKYPVHTLLRTM